MNLTSWRPFLFLAALVLYALFSSSTPDEPGLAEILIALFLISSIGITVFLRIFSGAFFFDRAIPSWVIIGCLALFYSLLVPCIMALGDTADPVQMARDMIPMCYAFLPLFLWPHLQKDPALWRKILLAGLLIIGGAFALRYFFIIGKMPWQIGHKTYRDDFLYLALSPEVMFSAIAFSAVGLRHFLRTGNSFWKSGLFALLCASLSFLCFAALAGMLLRAAIVVGALTVIIILFMRAPRARGRFVFLIMLSVLMLCAAPQPFQNVMQSLAAKEEASGLNQRDAEFRAAVQPLLEDPVATWLGQGWGAKVLSPAVGGLRVPYTHTFLSYLWVKTGLVGVILFFSYLASLLAAVLRQKDARNSIVSAALATLALALTLYTSYKTLGFGLLLSFLSAGTKQNDRRENNV